MTQFRWLFIIWSPVPKWAIGSVCTCWGLYFAPFSDRPVSIWGFNPACRRPVAAGFLLRGFKPSRCHFASRFLLGGFKLTCHQGFKRTRLKPVRVCCWHVAGCRPTDFSVGLQLKGLTIPFTNKFQLLSSLSKWRVTGWVRFRTNMHAAFRCCWHFADLLLPRGCKWFQSHTLSAGVCLASTCRLHVADQRPVSALVPSQHWLWHSNYLPPCPSYLPTHPPTYLPTKQLANQPNQTTHPPTHPPNQPTKHKTRTNQGREGKGRHGNKEPDKRRQGKTRETVHWVPHKGNCSLVFSWTQSIL